MKKPCPACNAPIEMGLLVSNSHIYRCPKCLALTMEDPKRDRIGMGVLILGMLLSLGIQYQFDSNKLWNILIFTGAMLIWFYIRNLKIVKKDFVIRNKDTKQIAYIDKKEWNEILKNSMGKENNFEITETL
jgi:hypothetical protein